MLSIKKTYITDPMWLISIRDYPRGELIFFKSIQNHTPYESKVVEVNRCFTDEVRICIYDASLYDVYVIKYNWKEENIVKIQLLFSDQSSFMGL